MGTGKGVRWKLAWFLILPITWIMSLDRIAAHAAAFDGSAEATLRRKARAETLRRLITVSDYSLSEEPPP